VVTKKKKLRPVTKPVTGQEKKAPKQLSRKQDKQKKLTGTAKRRPGEEKRRSMKHQGH
jgi:hypothetical protein